MLQSLTDYLLSPRIAADQPRGRGLLRSPFPFEPMDAVVLLVYACVLAWGAMHHRPWIDEAQAWLIARDVSVRELLLRRLHYEGAPAMWHLLLKAAIAAHLPYAALNLLGGAFALLGIVVFLRLSPFPRVFRWLLPFTFYLQYQYAVIARPYVLYPLLLFALCAVYGLRTPKPVFFGVIAGLLVNINAHAAILSCAFAVLYLHDLYRARELAIPQVRRQAVVATCVFLAFCALSVLVAFPAPDAMVVPTATGRVKKANPMLVRLLPPEQLPATAPPLDLPLDQVAAQRAARNGDPNTPAQAAPPASPQPSLLHRATHKLALVTRTTADVATFPIAESNLLSVAFLAIFGVWLWSRRSLRFVLPWMVAVPAAAFIWVYDHHTGLFGLALVAAAWLSLTRPGVGRGPRAIPVLTSVVALLVIVLQIGWTAHAVLSERRQPYDAGQETEAFLAANYPGERIDAFSYQTVSLQPYAAHNLFGNWDSTYWLWSNANPIDLRRTEALAQPPDVVVIGDLVQDQDSLYNQWHEDAPAALRPSAEMITYWQEHGYRETHRFCGVRYMRAGADNTVCEVIFERSHG